MRSNRHNHHAITGYVNFPNHLPSSGEGGTFVRLVVIPHEHDEPADEWMNCCGGNTHVLFDESLVGDNWKGDVPMPVLPDVSADSPEFLTEWVPAQKAQEEWFKRLEKRHFPFYDEGVDTSEPPARNKRERFSRWLKKVWEFAKNPAEYEWKAYTKERVNNDRYVSSRYLAVINLGSTGWSSMDQWVCQYEDLTPQGKVLHDSLTALYGGKADIILTTWKDT